jgi:3-oxoacyl-ACP reductase-like protein
MSVFGDILSKIFKHPHAQAAPQAPRAAQAPQPVPAAAVPAAAAAPAATSPGPAVDVEAVLEAMAKDNGEALNWRESIVDLMKLLSIDSSLANRKALAGELGYTGDTDDSAAMNIWLHGAVMRKLAENGGMVPDSLR